MIAATDWYFIPVCRGHAQCACIFVFWCNTKKKTPLKSVIEVLAFLVRNVERIVRS